MPIEIKYTGTQQRWPELATTGKQSVWMPGQIEERDDVEAGKLLATGLFKAEPVPLYAIPSDGGVAFDGPTGIAIARRAVGYLRDVVLFGDSLSAMNSWSGATSIGRPDNGYLTWATALAGVELNVVRNAGIGGNTTAEMLARIDADVLAYQSDVVIEMSGINGIETLPVETQIQNKVAIWQKLLAAGRYVIAMSTTPHGGGTDPGITNIARLNALAAEFWRGRTDGEFVDLHPFVTNTSIATAPWKTDFSYDFVHPTNLGAYWMAQALVPTLRRLFAPRRLVSSPRDTLQYDMLSKNILTNPLFLGTGGVNGTGCTGTIPTDWRGLCNANVSAVHSVAPANSGVGQKLVATITATATGYYSVYNSSVFTNAVVGDVLQSSARIKVVSAVNMTGLKFGIASTKNTIDWGRLPSAGEQRALPPDFELMCADSYPGTWSSGNGYGNVTLRADFTGAGSAVIEIERAEVRRR